ncbi:MAG TPA: hypothetical protein VG842_09970, partial [Sediminibacterium sp.]|nr:hypothetical protein [Sediminibacterium sp.]
MIIQEAIVHEMTQLKQILTLISSQEYNSPSEALSGASIGQHVRHILEMFQCLDNGYETGLINYEARKRERRIETDPLYAMELMTAIVAGLDKPDKPLQLKACYQETAETVIAIDTNYQRELVYNLEHTVHHMALIRVGIRE